MKMKNELREHINAVVRPWVEGYGAEMVFRLAPHDLYRTYDVDAVDAMLSDMAQALTYDNGCKYWTLGDDYAVLIDYLGNVDYKVTDWAQERYSPAAYMAMVISTYLEPETGVTADWFAGDDLGAKLHIQLLLDRVDCPCSKCPYVETCEIGGESMVALLQRKAKGEDWFDYGEDD